MAISFLRIFPVLFLFCFFWGLTIIQATFAAENEQETSTIEYLNSIARKIIPLPTENERNSQFYDYCQRRITSVFERKLEDLGAIVKRGRRPSCFISYAWHDTTPPADAASAEELKRLQENKYYRDFTDRLNLYLQKAGFLTTYDQNRGDYSGIEELGPEDFMNQLLDKDIVIGVCTPRYKEKIESGTGGAYREFSSACRRAERRLDRSFFVPILLHASDKDYPTNQLIVSGPLENAIYIDWRDREMFFANFQELIKRLGTQFAAKNEGDTGLAEQFRQKSELFSNVMTESLRDLEEEILIEALRKQKEILQNRLANLQRAREAVFVLGPTGAGKSTLVSLLKNIPLEARRNRYRKLTLYSSSDTNVSGDAPHIGHGTATGTYLPMPFSVQEPNTPNSPIIFWDCPGFDDVGGAQHDILHMASLVEALKPFEQMKVLLVLDEKRLEIERSAAIIELVNQMVRLFDPTELLRMCSLIVTGATDYDSLQKLQDYANDQTNDLTPEARGFLNSLNPLRIWSMPKPDGEGPYSPAIEGFWQTVQNSMYPVNPSFKVSLSGESLLFLKRLSDRLNRHIAEELQDSNSPLMVRIAEEIFTFNGKSSELRQRVDNYRTHIERIGQPIDEGENIASRFEDLWLNSSLLIGKLAQIDTLKRLLGNITNVGPEEVYFTFDPTKWAEGLQSTRLNLESLWNSLRTPTSSEKTPRPETFTAPESEGIVVKKEKFSLPTVGFEGREITTFEDFNARRSLTYSPNDLNRQSTVQEVYMIQREGNTSETLEGRSWTEPYRLQSIRTEIATPDTLNFRIYKTYQLPGGGTTVPPFEYTILENEIRKESQAPRRYEHDDNTHVSYEIVRCYMENHQGDHIEFGPYPNKRNPFNHQKIIKKIKSHSNIDSTNRKVSLTIEEVYRDIEGREYGTHDVLVHNQSIDVKSTRDEPNDNQYKLARFVTYTATYGTLQKDLPEHHIQDINYTKGGTVPGQRQAGNLDLVYNTVPLDVQRYALRPDGTQSPHHWNAETVTCRLHRGAERVVNDDRAFLVRKYAYFSAIYENSPIPLGEHELVDEQKPYTEERKRRVLFENTVNALRVSETVRHQVLNVCTGYEDIARRFIGGKLIYKPNRDNDVGRIEIPFSTLSNPLEGTFDLSSCGDTGRYLSIATGYRKGQKAENANKLEVWIVPKFVIEKELATTARHLAPIMDKFTSPVGIFWTHGNWDNRTALMGLYNYLTVQNFDELSNGENLYEKWMAARWADGHGRSYAHMPCEARTTWLWQRCQFIFIFN